MEKALEIEVRNRAKGRCEYCMMPQMAIRFKFPLDHIRAKQHGGETKSDNLTMACFRCNAHRGPNVAGIDPETGNLVPLFNPRCDKWSDHFKWEGPHLIGITDVGRVTIHVLAINHPNNITVREALIEEGSFPPAP